MSDEQQPKRPFITQLPSLREPRRRDTGGRVIETSTFHVGEMGKDRHGDPEPPKRDEDKG